MPWASASDHTVLNGSTGDECRAPRIQSGNGATGKLLLRDKQYPSVSAEAAPAVDRNNSALGGGSVQARSWEGPFPLVMEAKENLERHSGAAGWSQ